MALLLALLLTTARASVDCAANLEGVTPTGAVELVAALLPEAEAASFRDLARAFLALPIVPSRRASHIRYRNRLVDFSVNRSRHAKLRWRPESDRERLIESTIDLVTEAAFIPVRRTSIYLRKKSAFIEHNLEVMEQKLRFKLFTLTEVAPAPSPLNKVAQAFTRVLRPFLPVQFAVLRGMKLDAAHKAAFDSKGPRGLYDHIKRREGFELAVRYWGTHLTNIQTVLTAAYTATILPGIMDTWSYLLDLHALNVSPPDWGSAQILWDSMRSTPEHVVRVSQDLARHLGPEEQAALARLFQIAP